MKIRSLLLLAVMAEVMLGVLHGQSRQDPLGNSIRRINSLPQTSTKIRGPSTGSSLYSAGRSLTSGLRQGVHLRQKVREHAVSAFTKHSQYRELAVYDWQGALLRARQPRASRQQERVAGGLCRFHDEPPEVVSPEL